MRNKFLWSAVAALVIVGVIMAASSLPGAFAADPGQEAEPTQPAPQRTISVNGSGRIMLDPDIAMINIGVHTENSDAQAAVTENNAQAQAVIDALVGFGIAERDISTSSFSIFPRQNYDNEGNLQEIVYVVDNMVQVTVRDLDSIGEILDAAVSAGANSINGIQFTVEDSSAAYETALAAAVENARSRAEVLAEAAGVELGAVQTISSYVGGGPIPVYQDFRVEMAAAESSVPISPGQTELSVEVSVVYEIQ
jgi:uncharacterized protein YggE